MKHPGNNDSEPPPLRTGTMDLKCLFRHYPRTICYAIAGFIVGGILDMLPLVGWLTAGAAKFIGFGLGAGLGMAVETNVNRWLRMVESMVISVVQMIMVAVRQRGTKSQELRLSSRGNS
ncbi:MAG: hypothetical protein KatS3mg110_2771 [Pirellulaceae bacterium]|nr:MAG: hypothetical protein KatS3mg110_2771 [Pirellulaceae bacterium]